MSLESWLVDVWYRDRGGRWLAPLGWLGQALSAARRALYRIGGVPRCRLPVPVIVVGNITAGGTGKTPLVLWLAGMLKSAGRRPGLLCRGYRGNARHWPQLVDGGSDPEMVGDEAVLLARRSGCPVVAGPDRCLAGRHLVEQGVDIVISDDGLQHLRLRRDLEIAVIDGQRGFGNRRFLPAGPLRDPVSRLDFVDLLVVNGASPLQLPDALSMKVSGQHLVALTEAATRPLTDFAQRRVHAVAGIGNPTRFFDLLRSYDIQPIEHRFDDHAGYTAADFRFDDELPIVMTEKDAIKVTPFATRRMWMVPVEATFDTEASHRLRERVTALTMGTA